MKMRRNRGSWILYMAVFLLAKHAICGECFTPSATAQNILATSLFSSTNNKVQKRNPKKKRAEPRSKAKNIKSNMELFRRPPPLLVDFEANTSADEQEARKSDKSILNCEHFKDCAGCLVGQQVTNIDTLESAQRYFADERYDGTFDQPVASTVFPTIIPSKTTFWRTQAKLVAASKSSSSWINEGCTFGLYKRGSHEVLPIPNCVVHHPSINRAVEILEKATAMSGTSAYSENSREGDLRYVQLQVERVTGKVCLTLVWNAKDLKGCQPSLTRLLKNLKDPIFHSIWCHCNDSLGNTIFSRSPGRWHRMSGPEFLREPLAVQADSMAQESAGWLYFTPLNFRQGNLDGFDILALDVARAVPGRSKVCELYGGVGILGLTALAHHSSNQPLQWLRCSDENPANLRCFYRAVDSLSSEVTGFSGHRKGQNQRYGKRSDNSESTGMTLADLTALIESGEDTFSSEMQQDDKKTEKVSYKVASATKALLMGEALGASVLIVDPPRKGLEDEVVEELCKPFNPDQPYVESTTLLTMPDEQVNWANDIQTLVYVSCGFAALARDCDRLLNSDAGWVLQSSTGYLLFPGSDHIETLAIFKRK